MRFNGLRLNRGRGIVLLLSVAALGGVALLDWGRPGDPSSTSATPHPATSASTLPARSAAGVTTLPPPPAALASVAATQRAAPEPSRAASPYPVGVVPPAEAEVEVCGVGRARAGSPEATALAKEADTRRADAMTRLFAWMATHADPAVRAAALLGDDRREELARLAWQTSNATVYAFALQACARAGTKPAACAQLSPHRMAALDPLNVVSWLRVAEEASASANEQGVAEAVHRASLATVSKLREFAFADLALSAIPADWPVQDAVLASAQVLRIHAELALPSYLPVFNHCSADRARDFNVRQTCERLARVLLERGDTIVDHGVGRRIGERAGWSSDTVELLEARHAAYKQFALSGEAPAEAGSPHEPCEQLVQGVQIALAHARHGELFYARSRWAQVGASDAEAVLELRRGRQAASSPK